MKEINADLVMFGVGAVGYSALEILWRGYTHPSMMLAGGICFLSFSRIAERMKHSRTLYRCIAGSAAVTTVELCFGIVFNLLLQKSVWDYSRIPLNFMGQICLLYSVLWGFLCIPCIPLAGKIRTLLTA